MTVPTPSHKVLVTGGTGFVGKWVVDDLVRRLGPNAVAAPHFSANSPISLDIANRDDVCAAIAEFRPTAVIHLAAVANPNEARADPLRAWQVNVIGTLNVARAVLEFSPRARFVFIGSSEAYGASFVGHDRLDEGALLQPTSCYGATKAAADLMIGQMRADGLAAIRFRPFNHTGPGQPATYVVSSLAEQIARIEAGLQPPAVHVGKTAARRDFLDVRDVARAYVHAALTPNLPTGGVYNLASGMAVSIGEVIEMFKAVSGVAFEVISDSARIRDNDVETTSGDPTLAREVLGWSPQITLEQTLFDTLQFWRTALSS